MTSWTEMEDRVTAQHTHQAQAHVRPKPPYEDRMETYARQTRTGVVVIAWIVAIFAITTVALGIWIGVKAGQASNSGSVTSSSCVSQGGTIPGC